jgi:hypothetical protein
MGLIEPNDRDQRSTTGRDHCSKAPPTRVKDGAQNEYRLGLKWPRIELVETGFFEIEMELGLWRWRWRLRWRWVFGDGDEIEMMSTGLGEGSREAKLEERGERESMEERETKEIIKTML